MVKKKGTDFLQSFMIFIFQFLFICKIFISLSIQKNNYKTTSPKIIKNTIQFFCKRSSFFDCHQRIIAHTTEKSKAFCSFSLSLSFFLSKTHKSTRVKAKSSKVLTHQKPNGSKFPKPLILQKKLLF